MGQALGISSPVTHYNVHNWTSSDLDVAISEANEMLVTINFFFSINEEFSFILF